MMSRLGIPAERIAARLKINRKTAKKYSENPRLIRSLKKSLKKGDACHKVAEEHGCPEPLVWSIALEGKSDRERFKLLGWGLRTWDHWYFLNIDQRFGDEWPIRGKAKPDLILFDPPYFKKQSHNYDPDGISGLSKEKYLEFLENFFSLAHLNVKKSAQMAFINADWRDFQNTSVRNEMTGNSIMIDDYLHIIKKSGWHRTHIIQAPLSSERFNAGVVSAMQKKKILGVTSRYIIISEKR